MHIPLRFISLLPFNYSHLHMKVPPIPFLYLALHSLAKVSFLVKLLTILSPKDYFLCLIVINNSVSMYILLSSILWLASVGYCGYSKTVIT